MIKPKYLLISALALLSSPAFAQTDTAVGLRLPTQKGSWMLGSNLIVGELAFGSTSSDYRMVGAYDVTLNPRAGYFVKDNLLVGGMVNVTFSGNAFNDGFQYDNQIVGLGIFARKYFGKASRKDGQLSQLRFFVEAGASYSKGWATFINFPGEKEHFTYSTGTLHVMPGVNYFFTKNIALEGGLYMSHTGASSNILDYANRARINLGLQIFLGR